jgi:predicted HD phosphohydrolase
VGHLHVQSLKPNGDFQPVDHASLGAQMLKPLLGQAVSEPVRLHVLAKRYLVTTRENYARKLSADALQSLARQGGHLSEEECAEFERHEFFADAIKLRVWDDLGKKEGWFEVAPHDALDDLRALMLSVSATCVT